jgi:hypothetical protein
VRRRGVRRTGRLVFTRGSIPRRPSHRDVEYEPHAADALGRLQRGGSCVHRARDFLATVPNLVLDKPFDATELVRVIRCLTG